MPKLSWDKLTERLFETGVDRGVLFTSDGNAVAWNGLTNVSEAPSGTGVTPYYLDGVKYINVAGRKEYGGNIKAYTYPVEFEEYDGWWALDSGLSMDEQPRKEFSFSYRTRVGDGIKGVDLGYKIHLVYNALAVPSSKDYSSLSEESEPSVFSWEFTTTPQRVVSQNVQLPLSHVTVDSRKTNPTQLRILEERIYGTDDTDPSFISLQEVLQLFENPTDTLIMSVDILTGLNKLNESTSVMGDLRGKLPEGLYTAGDNTRLEETATPGLYMLET